MVLYDGAAGQSDSVTGMVLQDWSCIMVLQGHSDSASVRVLHGWCCIRCMNGCSIY